MVGDRQDLKFVIDFVGFRMGRRWCVSRLRTPRQGIDNLVVPEVDEYFRKAIDQEADVLVDLFKPFLEVFRFWHRHFFWLEAFSRGVRWMV